MKIQELTEDLIHPLDKFLRQDPVRNVWLIHDLHGDREKSEFHIALKNSKIRGVLWIHDGFTSPRVVVRGERIAAANLLKRLEIDECHFWARPALAGEIKRRFPITSELPVDLMTLEKGNQRMFSDYPAKELSLSHVEDIAKLWREWRGGKIKNHVRRVREKLSERRNIYYGTFVGDELVSMVSGEPKLAEIAEIGGAYTLPEYRGEGRATSALSKVIGELLKYVKVFCLGVRSDNNYAKKVYRKVGFEKYETHKFLDLNTGFIP